jgi:hypothetical protein
VEKVRIFAAPEPAKPLNDAQMCGSFYFFYEFFAKTLAGKEKVRIFAALEPAKPLNDAQMCGSFFICLCQTGLPFGNRTPIPMTLSVCCNHEG